MRCVRGNFLSIAIVVGAIGGFAVGYIINTIMRGGINPDTVRYVGLPGKLLIRAFSLLIVPLIVCSLATGVAATKRGENKKLVIMTFILFVAFSSFASIFGATVMQILRPGDGRIFAEAKLIGNYSQTVHTAKTSDEDAFVDVLK